MEELKEKEVPEELKKKHSYTYWVNEHTKSRELPPEQQPVKLEKPISIVSR